MIMPGIQVKAGASQVWMSCRRFIWVGSKLRKRELQLSNFDWTIDVSRFNVEHGSEAAEVMNVHRAGMREVGDVVREREIRIKSNTKIVNRDIGGKSRGRRDSGYSVRHIEGSGTFS